MEVDKIDLKNIQKKLESGRTIEEIIADFDWKEFEGLVAEIFVANGFYVRRNLRFKTTRRYEIDVLAVRGDVVFAVDCKEWSRGRYKDSGLRAAVESHEERANHLKKFLKNNLIARKSLKIDVAKQEVMPIVVTWLQEGIERHSESMIVPVWKLNSFLNYLLLQSESFAYTE